MVKSIYTGGRLMSKRIFIGMVLGTWVIACACLAQAYDVVEVKEGGLISGTVKLSGDIPATEELKIDKDPEVCGKHMPRLSEKIIVDKGTKGVKNAVVYLVGVAKGKAFAGPRAEAEKHGHGGTGEVPAELGASGEYTLDQKECTFIPHVQVIPAGGMVELRNGDPLMHNLHSYSMKNSSFNESIPGDGKPIHKKFDYPEVIKVGCDVHKWMNAWVVVRDNPYYAVTAEDGSFKITDVPPGTYKLSIWHEAASKEDLKKLVKDITVEAKKEIKADFEVALK
jgi:plastocyanin